MYMLLYSGKVIINMAFILVIFISGIKHIVDCADLVITWHRSQTGFISFFLRVYKHFIEYKSKDIFVRRRKKSLSYMVAKMLV